MKILPVEAELFHVDGRADGWTDVHYFTAGKKWELIKYLNET